jgi:hypothetical protein
VSQNQEAITIDHLNALASICEFVEQQSSRCASDQSLQRVRGYYLVDPEYQDIREGVVYFSQGWGWRLRPTWQRALADKRDALAVAQVASS